MGWPVRSLLGAKIGYFYFSDFNFWMTSSIIFEKLKFHWKLIRLQKFPITYCFEIQTRLGFSPFNFFSKHFFRLTLY